MLHHKSNCWIIDISNVISTACTFFCNFNIRCFQLEFMEIFIIGTSLYDMHLSRYNTEQKYFCNRHYHKRFFSFFSNSSMSTSVRISDDLWSPPSLHCNQAYVYIFFMDLTCKSVVVKWRKEYEVSIHTGAAKPDIYR